MMTHKHLVASNPILVVEDSEEDIGMLQCALKKLSISLPLIHCADGDEALDYLYHRQEYARPSSSPRPCLILLDLQLLTVNGHEVLQVIKNDEQLRLIPVIIWSSSTNPEDIKISFQQGATSYILKPMNIKDLLHVVEMLNHYWFGVNLLPEPDDN